MSSSTRSAAFPFGFLPPFVAAGLCGTLRGMDETTKAIIEKITRRSSAGIGYDLAALSPNDLARMAAEATGDLPEGTFDVVLGLAYRGILFAAAVAGGHQVAIFQLDGVIHGPALQGRRVLLADDLYSGDGRFAAAARAVESLGGEVIGCACIVDRTESGVVEDRFPVWSAFQTKDL
jgi:adenine/guanine phosphoribosyltransferase-like PRPP-binding protein